MLYIDHGETPVGKELIAWQRDYIERFLTAINRLPDKTQPVSREAQNKVIALMKDFLPSDATLFLFDYELDVTLPLYWRRRGVVI